MKRNGFSLVEMLVVIAIIGILAAILLPMVGASRDRALATKSRELVVQISNSWLAEYSANRRFPPVDVIEQYVGSCEKVDGDLMFPCSQAAINLLNWYGYEMKTSAAKSYYADVISHVDTSSKTLPDTVQTSNNGKVTLRERFFERDDIYWRYGLVNAWGAKKARAAAGSGNSNFAAGDYLAYVVIDTGMDGKVKFTTPTGESFEVRKSVVAFCPGKNGAKGSPDIRTWD